jgi:hypothetical protein
MVDDLEDMQEVGSTGSIDMTGMGMDGQTQGLVEVVLGSRFGQADATGVWVHDRGMYTPHSEQDRNSV